MKIAVFGRTLHAADAPYVQELFNQLHERGFDVMLYDRFAEEIRDQVELPADYPTFTALDRIDGQADYLFSLGGDGTVLNSLTVVRDSNVPIMGINIGRLGFLSSIGKEQIDTALHAIEHGTYVADRRTLIHLDSNTTLFGETPYALNEFAIHKRDSSSMITIHTFINGEFMNTFWADGLIISTPTGSTGYSLSCGGPIIFPSSKSFVITAVAPHNLNVRPIIVPDDAVISFDVEGRADNFLAALDSRYISVPTGTQLAVRKEDFTVSLIRLDESNFLTTLRQKLLLGLDKRN